VYFYLAVVFPVSWSGWVRFEEKKKWKLGEKELERLLGSGAADDVDFEAAPPYGESCRIAVIV
jgi:hypothetical protein